MKKLLALALSLMIGLSLVLVGCGGDSSTTSTATTTPASTAGASTPEATSTADTDDSTAGTTVNAKDEIVYHVHVAPNKLDPAYATGAYEWLIFINIYDTLFLPVKLDFNNIVPWLVEEYEVSEDNLTWTMKIKEGIKFHNGEELTAEDCAYSIMRAKESASFAPAIEAFESVDVIDDYTFVLNHAFTYPCTMAMLAHTQLAIVNKALYEEYGEGAREAVVGTGPYKMTDWGSDDSVTLEYTGDYHGGEPQIKKVTFRTIVDTNAATIAFESGELDVFARVNLADEERLIDDDNYSSVVFDRVVHQGVSINNQVEPFTDIRVRRAMNHAVDKQSINLIAAEGNYNPDVWVKTTSEGEGFAEADITKYEYDVEKAKELMAEAGYDESNPLAANMYCTLALISQGMSAALQDSFAQINLNINVEPVETGTWLNKVGTKDYTLSWSEWSFQYWWGNLMYYFMHHDGLFYDYENIDIARVNELTELGLKEMDQAKRVEYYSEMLEIVSEEAICVPVWRVRGVVLTTKGLKVYPDQANTFASVFEMEWTDEEVFSYDATWLQNQR